ncbi:MAG: Flp pilus assembly complex ATPase component TadA, partial [Myxococcales bacterium]|nr:Flp pilus assembly complex ATPase component TadA [Myxococcales bacterium]
MSSLIPIIQMIQQSGAELVQLVPGEPGVAVVGGKSHRMGSQPVAARATQEMAQEVMALDEIPAAGERARVVRHEIDGVTYVIEVARQPAGITLAIRPPAKGGVKAAAPAPPPAAAAPAPAPAPASPAAPAAAPAPAPAASAATDGAKRRASGQHGRASRPPPAKRNRASVAPEPPATPVVIELDTGREGAKRGSPVVAAGPTGEQRIDPILREMISRQASDLHLSADNPIAMRIHGEMCFFTDRPALGSDEIFSLVRDIMTDKARREFEEVRDADFAYEVPGLARFRVNVFVDRKGVGTVMRQIPAEVITAGQLGLPQACLDFCHLTKGLVLVTGPTGSGKSTTLAAMI